MLTKKQALDEARKQKQALKALGGWRRNLFIAASIFLCLSVFGLQSHGAFFVLGVCAAVLGGLSVISMFIVNLSIRNGHRNVEKILDSLQPTAERG